MRQVREPGEESLAAMVLGLAVKDGDTEFIFKDSPIRDFWCAVIDLDPDAYQRQARRIFREHRAATRAALMEALG